MTIGKQKIVASFKQPTPSWATWTFRIFYHFTTVFGIWLAATKIVPEANKFEALLIASAVDRLVWGIAQGIGVSKDSFEQKK